MNACTLSPKPWVDSSDRKIRPTCALWVWSAALSSSFSAVASLRRGRQVSPARPRGGGAPSPRGQQPPRDWVQPRGRASRERDPRRWSGAPLPRGLQPPRVWARTLDSARISREVPRARRPTEWPRARGDKGFACFNPVGFLSQTATVAWPAWSRLYLSSRDATSCGARQLNSTFTPPAVGGGAERPGDRRFSPASHEGSTRTIHDPSRVCPNPSVAGQRRLGSRPTADALFRGLRRHPHSKSHVKSAPRVRSGARTTLARILARHFCEYGTG